jgi:hypothetical protein
VAPQLAHHRRHGEGGEHHAVGGIEALDRLQHPDRRHLQQVLDRLALAGEAPGAVLREPAVLLDQLVADGPVVGLAVPAEALVDHFALEPDLLLLAPPAQACLTPHPLPPAPLGHDHVRLPTGSDVRSPLLPGHDPLNREYVWPVRPARA